MMVERGEELPLARVMLQEQLQVADELQRRMAAARLVPDIHRLPFRWVGGPFRLLIGITLGFTVSAVAILFAFVLVNMVLHVAF